MNIEVLQPRPFDLVGHNILIAGNGVGFEGTLTISVGEGHDVVEGFLDAGSTSVRQFQGSIEIPPDTAFQLPRLFLSLSDDTAGEDAPPPTVTIPVLFGPLIIPGYVGYRNHTVRRGDTLSALARQFYGDPGKFYVIRSANAHLIDDPNIIFPGQQLRIPIAE